MALADALGSAAQVGLHLWNAWTACLVLRGLAGPAMGHLRSLRDLLRRLDARVLDPLDQAFTVERAEHWYRHGAPPSRHAALIEQLRLRPCLFPRPWPHRPVRRRAQGAVCRPRLERLSLCPR